MAAWALSRVAQAAAVALLLTACGGSGPGIDAERRPPQERGMRSGADATTTRAAELRAAMTSVLVTTGYLTAEASAAALADDAVLESARRTALVRTSDALEKAVGRSHPALAAELQESWLRAANLVVDFADSTTDQEAISAAVGREADELGALLAETFPDLPPETGAALLGEPMMGLLEVVQAQAQGDPRQYALLAATADSLTASADTLTRELATSAGIGRTDTPAVTLRARLTGVLTDQAFLLPAAAQQLRADRGDRTAPLSAAALEEVERTTMELTRLVTRPYPRSQLPFLDSWRVHDELLLRVAIDPTGVERELDAWRASFGRLLDSFLRTLPQSTVAEQLRPYVAAMTTAVRGREAAALEEAAERSARLAALLAAGLAEDQRLA